MKEIDKALKKLCDNLFTYQYQKYLADLIEEKRIENWVNKENMRLERIKSLSIEDFIEELNPKPLDIDTQISNIKRQLKYEKNPLAIKNLNRKMNKLIKEKNV